MAEAPLQTALAAIWKKNQPQTRERLAVLQRAAKQLSTTGAIEDDLRADAATTAHKMAGSLGMFGLHSATEAARGIEHSLDKDGPLQPERLREQVDALTALLGPHLGDGAGS
ncbi:Hpt domain-containing protein [Terriglobus sp. RCC_193]|uniref:Hpt domain-containing protein n=1 Tax=Terriglobus sp. RCC_193 TaxID=3239218 RepID=UPI00352526EF